MAIMVTEGEEEVSDGMVLGEEDTEEVGGAGGGTERRSRWSAGDHLATETETSGRSSTMPGDCRGLSPMWRIIMAAGLT